MNLTSATNVAVYAEPKAVVCDACGSLSRDSAFILPVLDGPYLNQKPIRARQFYRCAICGHLSVDLYEPSRYTDHYRNLQTDYHSCHDIDCSRYKNVAGILQENGVRRVLDVGCGTGTFLKMLPDSVERFGVELSLEASNKARADGIRIISLEELQTSELMNSFDAVTAIDVVEHAKDLIQLRDYLAMALRPGGIVVLLTGDFESKTAKFLGRYWYYLHYSEHVSFFSARSMTGWLAPAFKDIQIVRCSHHPFPFAPKELASLARMCLVFPLKWLIHQFSQSIPVHPTLWTLGDHMLVKAVRR